MVLFVSFPLGGGRRKIPCLSLSGYPACLSSTLRCNTKLENEIRKQLAPYLLAIIIAKSDQPDHPEIVIRRLNERFEVRATDDLRVSYTMQDNSSETVEVSFSKFYLQTTILPGRGAIEEAHYVLYYCGSKSASLLEQDIDADALGAAVAPIFLDGVSDELAHVFPRIATRYYQSRGSGEAMQEFLHRQLEVSLEALDRALAYVKGEEPVSPMLPPPPIIIRPRGDEPMNEPIMSLERHTEDMGKQARELLQRVGQPSNVKPAGSYPVQPNITGDQQKRGIVGEEEIKRRLGLPGGWDGLCLLQDVRQKDEGCDFLCMRDGIQVKVEVKTYAKEEGRVFFSERELLEAANQHDKYFLIGVCDDGEPPPGWRTFILADPVPRLLQLGKLTIKPTLEIRAAELFDQNSSH